MSAPGHGAPSTGSGDELDPDEPRTPLWLPLLGLTLFLSALIYLLVGGTETAPVAAAPEGSASAAPPTAPPN
jgi:hypothetical protein